jgi:hypothetical protein
MEKGRSCDATRRSMGEIRVRKVGPKLYFFKYFLVYGAVRKCFVDGGGKLFEGDDLIRE